jgi:flagellar hook-length control protein FliK
MPTHTPLGEGYILTDLPIASPASAPVPAARPAANALLRGSPARNGTAQPNASPFQDALALELGLALDGPMLPGLGVPAAAKAGSNLKPGEDATQAASTADASLGLALIGLPPLPPALGSLLPPAEPVPAPLAPASAPTRTTRGVLAPNAHLDTLATTGVAPNAGLELPAAPAAADIAVPGKFPRAAAGEIAQTSAAQISELQLPVTPAAADFAVSGKFPLSTEGEIRREVAFDANLLDQHKAVPTPSAAIHTGGAAPAQAAQAPVAALEARVGARGWDQGLGDKLVWMAGQRQQVAELHLNPPDLGPLKITLTLNNDQASAQFVSAHAQVREAIETAMPRLREMLADSGITLGNASVSTGAFREQAQPQQEPRGYPAVPATAEVDPGAVTRGERLLRQSHGLVDTFA